MRTRSRSVQSDDHACYYENQVYNGICSDPNRLVAPVSYLHGQNVEFKSSESMQDIVTPQWNRCRRDRVIVNNPMESAKAIETSTVMTGSASNVYRQTGTCVDNQPMWVVNGSQYGGEFVAKDCLLTAWEQNYLDFPELTGESEKSQALHKAWAGQELTEVQTLVMIAELTETLYSLRSVYIGMGKLLKKFNRLGISRSLLKEMTAEDLANKYMFLRYALRPMVYDVIAVTKALNGKTKSIGDRFTSRGTVNITESVADKTYREWTTVTSGRSDWTKLTFSRHSSATIEARAGVLSRVDAISKMNTWGLDQPIEAMWELIPFSFVVDWFVDVGTTIGAFTPEYGLTPLASWVVLKKTLTQSLALTDTARVMTPPSGTESLVCDYDFKNCVITKSSVATVRTPEPKVSYLPRFRLKLDLLKLTDLALIAKQLLKK